MQVKLVLNNRTVRCLQENLGEGRVTIIENDGDHSKYVEFEINSFIDALYLIHAGQDSGIELALYGTKGDPKKAA
jgi:hypothetical protein